MFVCLVGFGEREMGEILNAAVVPERGSLLIYNAK